VAASDLKIIINNAASFGKVLQFTHYTAEEIRGGVVSRVGAVCWAGAVGWAAVSGSAVVMK
jgi:hypothetical protein